MVGRGGRGGGEGDVYNCVSYKQMMNDGYEDTDSIYKEKLPREWASNELKDR